MTTFTSEDRQQAQKYVEEAPYHPGYEDAVVIKETYREHEDRVTKEVDELLKMKHRYMATALKIIEFIKESNKTKK